MCYYMDENSQPGQIATLLAVLLCKSVSQRAGKSWIHGVCDWTARRCVRGSGGNPGCDDGFPVRASPVPEQQANVEELDPGAAHRGHDPVVYSEEHAVRPPNLLNG